MRFPKWLVSLCLVIALSGCGKRTVHWTEQMKSSSSVERLHAVHALQERVKEKDLVVPALAEALKDEDPFVRRDTARALGSFGPEAKDAVPQLFLALRDREPGVRKAATQALKKIDADAPASVGQGR